MSDRSGQLPKGLDARSQGWGRLHQQEQLADQYDGSAPRTVEEEWRCARIAHGGMRGRGAHGPPKAPADQRNLRMRSYDPAGAPTTSHPRPLRSRAFKVVHEPVDAVLDGEDHVSGQGIAHNTRQILW